MGHDGRPHLVVRIFTSRFFLLGAFVVAAIIAVSFGRAYYRDYEIRQQIRGLQAKVDELERKKLESLNLLGYVKSEAYVEDVARTQLGLKKPGERVIIVNGSTTSSGPRIGVEERPATPSWKKWWWYFVGE
ncbi:MAG: septum formation initiator family protein [Patescibacteria group bacterium]